MVVGYDSLLGSLATSLVALLRDGAGSRLCDLTYSEFLPRTGVPYVERVAKKDCAIDGFNFLAGNRVRLFLDAYPARGDVKREEPPYFGKGRISVWAKISPNGFGAPWYTSWQKSRSTCELRKPASGRTILLSTCTTVLRSP